MPAYWLPQGFALHGVVRVTTFGTLPQSIQGQSNLRWTTSLGITLAQPHAVVRASPILAGTGSFIHLPDKEFRYLRTVIVTAAVYRGFISELALLHLTFRHRAGVSPYTSSFDLAETCVFGKQSLEPIHCGPLRLRRQAASPYWGDPYPEVTGQFCRVP